MSLWNTRPPGVVLRLQCIAKQMALIDVERQVPRISSACIWFWGSCVWITVQIVFATIWFILLQIALAWGFLTVVGTCLILNYINFFWNSFPVNSPPLLWTQHMGRGYLASHVFENWLLTCCVVLEFIQTISVKFVTMSMIVRTLNSSSCPVTSLTFQGPIRSTATLCHGAMIVSLGSNSP